MIYYNTSNDKICRLVIEWCKDNNYLYSLDTENKERNMNIYPFTILAPSYQENNLLEKIKKQ
jgi:hypothetical protein